MIVTIDQFKQIVGVGGGLVIDASLFTFNQIKDITSAAKNGARITLRNVSGLSAHEMIELATLAPGTIVFDLTR